MEIEEIIVDKYRFIIKDNTYSYEDRILSRNFSIGGFETDCVNVSIKYTNNEPINASIPYLLHEPECSIDVPLDKGTGTILMIKTLLQYVHNKIPSITEFQFEDKSQIESASQEEMERKKSINRKKGTHIVPIPLYFFSIAFNGQTWYEKHFKAKQKNNHDLYRKKVNELLYSKELKKMDFLDFLDISPPPSKDIIDELKPYYEKSNTFYEFFQYIPPKNRIRLVRGWIENFMLKYLENVFSNKNWIIEIPIPITENKINESVIGGGKKKRRTKKYYYPNARIQLNPKHRGLLLGPEDI